MKPQRILTLSIFLAAGLHGALLQVRCPTTARSVGPETIVELALSADDAAGEASSASAHALPAAVLESPHAAVPESPHAAAPAPISEAIQTAAPATAEAVSPLTDGGAEDPADNTEVSSVSEHAGSTAGSDTAAGPVTGAGSGTGVGSGTDEGSGTSVGAGTGAESRTGAVRGTTPVATAGFIAPHPRAAIRPEYPRGARKAGWEGTVRIRASVDDTGVVQSAEVASSSGHDVLDATALETVLRTVFFPARKDGVDIPCRLTIPVTFRLQ